MKMASSILSLELNKNNLISNSNGCIFKIGSEIFIFYQKIENNLYQIYIQPLSKSPILIYSSNNNVKISKVSVDQELKRVWICGSIVSPISGFYASTDWNGITFSNLMIKIRSDVKKIENLLILDSENILFCSISFNDQFWILHNTLNSIYQIQVSGLFSVKDLIFDPESDQLDIYVDVLNSLTKIYYVQIYRFSSSEILSSFV
jgi:hypothetical protein